MKKVRSVMLSVALHLAISLVAGENITCRYRAVGWFVRKVCVDVTAKHVFLKCPFSETLYIPNGGFDYVNYGNYDYYSEACPHDPHHYQACGNFDFRPLFPPTSGSSNPSSGSPVFVCGMFTCRSKLSPVVASGITLNRKQRCDGVKQCEDDVDEQMYVTCVSRVTGNHLTITTITALNNAILRRCLTRQIFTCKWVSEPGIPTNQVCNGRCDCSVTCNDELHCHGYSYTFTCNDGTELEPVRLCDGRRDCTKEEDEGRTCGPVNGYGHVITKGSNEAEENLRYCKSWDLLREKPAWLSLTNYSRCFPHVRCMSKLDQTNCSDSDIAPLSCPVRGYKSTVSRYIICHTKFSIVTGLDVELPLPVCDNGMDQVCAGRGVTPACPHLHKHQLCDNITDCPDGTDETGMLCRSLSHVQCRRSYGRGTVLLVPLPWLRDGVSDCEASEDEARGPEISTCMYGGGLSRVSYMCRDVFKCPGTGTGGSWVTKPILIEVPFLCDWSTICSSQFGTDVCSSTKSPVLTQVTQRDRERWVGQCVPGVVHVGPCSGTTFPGYSILGVTPLLIHLPVGKTTCRNFFGEGYVLMSCLGRCHEAPCPLEPRTHLSGETCSRGTRRTYSMSRDGYLTLVRQVNRGAFQVREVFDCGNGRCVSYDKVCDLVADCENDRDERNCRNSYRCNDHHPQFTPSYISHDRVCDGNVDCLDGSDEAECGNGNLIQSTTLRVVAMVIGIMAIVGNVTVIVYNTVALRRVRAANVATDKVLLVVVNTGDFMVGVYLVAIVTVDLYHNNDLLNWMVSGPCRALGILTTSGSFISLFAMTLLGLERVVNIAGKTIRVPLPLSRRVFRKCGAYVVGITVISVAIATIPLIPQLEDVFVNSFYFPQINFLRGFTTKANLMSVAGRYYGRLRGNGRLVSRDTSRRLLHRMFTDSYGGIEERTVHFYGNDPVCLFKYFVGVSEPHVGYTWGILGIVGLNFVTITVSYFFVLAVSRNVPSGMPRDNKRSLAKRNQRLQRKVMLIIGTDFLCWAPFVMICGAHSWGLVDARPWYSLFSIAILPLNAVLNPLIYNDLFRTIAEAMVRGLGAFFRSRCDSFDPRNAQSE